MLKSFVKTTIVTAGIAFATVVGTESALAGAPAPSAQSGANAGAAARQAQGQGQTTNNEVSSNSRSRSVGIQKQGLYNGGSRSTTIFAPQNERTILNPPNVISAQGSCVEVKIGAQGNFSHGEPSASVGIGWQPGARGYCKWSDNLQAETQKKVQEIRGRYNVKITVLEKKYQMSLEAVKACLQQRLQQGLPVGPDSCQNRPNQVNQGRQRPSSQSKTPVQSKGPGSN